MTDPPHHRPPPARPEGGKPTPARELNGEPPATQVESDLSEAHIELEGTRWSVRVLGRSGRASGASAHLLLLGFWESEDASDDPSLEALVAARTLEGLSTEDLEEAFSRATEPVARDRKSTFFQEAGQARRR